MFPVHINYRGFIITPMAEREGDLYAAMYIIRDGNGVQRASGVLGHYSSVDEAHAFALTAGKGEVDHRRWPSPAAA